MLRMLYLQFLHIPKREHVPEKVFMTRIMLSMLAMLTCLVILCSTTYAYFMANIAAGFNLETADYELMVSINDEPLLDSDADGKIMYTCPPESDNNEYIFTLIATGTASTGYCKVMIADKVYFTDQIYTRDAENTLTLEIHADPGMEIIFEPSWGTSVAFVNNEEPTYGGEEIIDCVTNENYGTEITDDPEDIVEPDDPENPGEPENPDEPNKPEDTSTEYILHIVREGETLESIAQLYETTVDVICECNELVENAELIVGQELRIPLIMGDITDP